MATVTEAEEQQQTTEPRLWPLAVIAIGMWAAKMGTKLFYPDTMISFMTDFYAPMTCGLLVIIGWMFASRVSWRQRLAGFALIVGLFVLAFVVSDKSMLFTLLMSTIPWAITAIAGFAMLKFIPWPTRRWLPVVATAGLCGMAMMLRLEGLTGTFEPDFSWRWAPSQEEIFLANAPEATGDQPLVTLPTELSTTDWPAFRGADRNGVVTGVSFPTDWKAAPPREVWRTEIGPGWGSFTVIGDTLFTQEQRGEDEAVTAYSAKDGSMLWMNKVPSRFTEAIGGPGPRSTPTYHEGKLYTQGAAGILQCIDPTNGQALWTADITKDTPAKPPQWGFSASPLIVGDLVITYGGSGEGKSTIAYNRADGSLAWTVGNGTHSYSSPQLATFGGVEQILMLSNIGLLSISPTDGTQLWFHEWDMGSKEMNRVLQPLVFGDDVLIGTFLGMGTRRISVTHASDAWNTEEKWTSKKMKPYFNDFVEHEGNLYGFDNEIFASIALENGKKNWKRGRYGHGQVLLVKDMNTLLILGEKGELVLLEANPQKHVELAKIQALEGKTWNHPVIAGNQLFVRNGQEAACYELGPGERAAAEIASEEMAHRQTRLRDF